MVDVRERQRQNICSVPRWHSLRERRGIAVIAQSHEAFQVQTWQGKEFKGPAMKRWAPMLAGDAFLAKPAIIAFQDFEAQD